MMLAVRLYAGDYGGVGVGLRVFITLGQCLLLV